MRKINYLIIIECISAFAMLNIASCNKDTFSGPPLASLSVTNAIVGGTSIRVGSNVTPVANNNFQQLTVLAGNYDLYVWPIEDSTKPYYTLSKFNAEDRGLYSLFLAGQSPTITGIVVNDNIPYHTDSTCGVRFINLIPNSTPLNITISTTPSINEVSSLAYLQYTDFKLYQAKAVNSSYVFQVRKASDNSILLNYTLSTPRFTNITLVISGLVGGSINMIRVNNDR